MSVKYRSRADDIRLPDVTVGEVHSRLTDRIIERNHYLECAPAGARHRYLITGGLNFGIIGAAMWGRPVGREIDQETTVELTRFWTEDWTPKNAESVALSQMMKDLGRKGYDRLIAYASVALHEGTIYKATNWLNLGLRWPASWDNREGRTMRDHGPKWKFEYVFEPGWFLPNGRRIGRNLHTRSDQI
jgi:hypothetical protein